MLFSSLLFLYIFLPLLLVFYFLCKSSAAKQSVLIIFSLLFYAWGEPIYVLLLIGLVAFNYFSGLLIDGSRSSFARKSWLCLSVVVNLGILAFFKYTNFILDNLSLLIGNPIGFPTVALPLGISFFTFQTMSYTIDVAWGKTPVQESFSKLLLYVSLFPQLVAGPIVRYSDIVDQMDNRKITMAAFNEGFFRFSVGLAKKVIVANACGQTVDVLLGGKAENCSMLGTWVGALFFALQIYYDFSGYSDMAIGLGHIFGVTFPENFNYPYCARTVTEFWRRWHMTLSSFFRDYVYIPLGGNRRHQLRNILIVWILTGMWHGAAWNFILWGLFYGILLMIEKKFLLQRFQTLSSTAAAVVQTLYMLVVTLVGWSLFYFDSDTFAGLGRLIGIGVPLTDPYVSTQLLTKGVLLIAALLFSFPVMPALRRFFRAWLGERTFPIAERLGKTAFTLAALLICTALLAGNSYNPFLYTRF